MNTTPEERARLLELHQDAPETIEEGTAGAECYRLPSQPCQAVYESAHSLLPHLLADAETLARLELVLRLSEEDNLADTLERAALLLRRASPGRYDQISTNLADAAGQIRQALDTE